MYLGVLKALNEVLLPCDRLEVRDIKKVFTGTISEEHTVLCESVDFKGEYTITEQEILKEIAFDYSVIDNKEKMK